MKIENVKIYDIDECIIASGYPMMTEIVDIQDEIKTFRLYADNAPFDGDASLLPHWLDWNNSHNLSLRGAE